MFGTRAGVFVDLFLVAQILVLPGLLVAIAFVRRGRVAVHAWIMRSLFFVFLATVVAFEVEVRTGPKVALPLHVLAIHLCFALPALILWARQMLLSKQAFLDPPRHRRRGRMLLVLLSVTVATGVWLYLVTFTRY
jgi:uncharacterized membrane protein YozB (DUF420 family)